MSTRGALGFRLNGADKMTYNHSDSYPSELGADVVRWCRGVTDWKEIKKRVMNMKKTDGVPTKELNERCDLLGLPASNREWYNVLRHTQGDLEEILNARYYECFKHFLLDSLFCEWAYIINLDTLELEIYRGFQKEKHDRGRYADKKGPRETYGSNQIYYPVALVATYLLLDIPEDWRQQCGED